MSETSINSADIGIIIYILRTLFICIYSCYTLQKLINVKTLSIKRKILLCVISLFISIFCGYFKYAITSSISIFFLIISLSITQSSILNIKFGYSMLLTLISVSIIFIMYFIAVFLSFIFNNIIVIKNDYINLGLISFLNLILLYLFFKIPRFKYGFSFLQRNINNEYFDIFILNISVTILFLFTVIGNSNFILTVNLMFMIIVFSIIAFITIQKAFTMYYKHKLLVNELESTKLELSEKNKEIDALEAEILEFSKTSHSIAHKQKSLEHKLNKLMLQTEVADELDLRDRLNDISEEYSSNKATTPLPKTDIEIIDDMISCMNAECKNNNIDFELQLNGNIHHMINNFVTKEELEILLADHIKDAIIAINHSDNINKSILVKLGLFDGEYILSIYDSGIEFEIGTLLDLGLKPSTTHKDDGGTGMGFMNTFDTLRKHSASLYINELNKPTKDNYTKSVTISFNNKNEYKVTSYRADKIKEKNNRDNLIIE